MDTDDKVMVQGIAHGRVQGVWFRAFTREQAQRHGLSGYARNQPDGTVAFALNGPRGAVETVLQAIHRGPPQAEVSHVEVSWHPATAMRGFSTS